MYPEGGQAFLGRLIASIFFMGVSGAAAGAIWATALDGSAAFGALCGGAGSATFAFVISPAYAGNRAAAAGFAMQFGYLMPLICIIGLIVWAAR